MSPTIVTDIGCTAPAPTPCTTRAKISAGIDQATAQRIDPTMKSPILTRITGLRPWTSDNFAYSGVVTACASRYPENSHGNSAKSPSSPTIVGTAVASTVASRATRLIVSMIDASTGPRCDRNPTPSTASALTYTTIRKTPEGTVSAPGVFTFAAGL